MTSEDEYFPDRIIAEKRVVYNVQDVRDSLRDFNNEEPTFNEVLEMILDFAKDDLSCNWGHQISCGEFIVYDPEGEQYI